MFGTYFYNESMRRMTVAFGQLFNKIQIKHKDSTGKTVQSISVPLAYAPKEKFLTRQFIKESVPGLKRKDY